MKFLDANGLALFTKKIFSKFVSNITGADNKITITKGDGTTNEINLNEVVKTDVIGEDPPDDDNSNKIASTRWVQKFVTTMVFKLISKLAGTEETGVSSSGSFLGVNWLIAQNGYICLGKLFGGLILQWGLLILKKDHTQEPDSNYVQESLNLPISLKIVVCGISTCNVLINTYCYIHATLPTLTIGRNPYNADTKHYYLIVGK
nr:MAG: hypothetical protein [Bacteriophage sp.]